LVSSPIWGSWPDIYCCVTVTVLLLWDALSKERTGLSFVYAVGPCQRSLSWVRVPWYSRPYFTVSDLRFHFLSPPTTRRVTVEVFDPASTRVCSVLLYSTVGPSRRHLVQGFCFAFFDAPLASVFVAAGTTRSGFHLRGNGLLCMRRHVNVFVIQTTMQEHNYRAVI
jgi:hypothetical protein